MRILVIRFSSLGDVVLATAAIHGLHEHYPDAEILVATKYEYLPVFENFPSWLSVIPLDPGQSESSYRKLFSAEQFDLVVDLHGSLRSRHLMSVVKSKEKSTVDKQTFRRFRMVWSKKGLDRPISTVDAYLLAAGITTKVSPRLHLSQSERSQAAEQLRAFPIRIGIGWGAKHPTKAVPGELWGRLLQTTRPGTPFQAVIFGLQSDRAAIEAFISENLASSSNISAHPMIGLKLRETVTHISTCNAFVTSDSGLMHVADALGVPTFGLFGPTHPSLGFAPTGERSRAFHAGTWCSPCHRHGSAPCFRDRRFCFEELNVDSIVSAVTVELEQPERATHTV